MESSMHKATTPPKQTALDAFMAKKTKIDAQLAKLQALSVDHFNTNPDTIYWGHVGDIARYADLLRQITDAAFNEGEHAR